MNEEKAHIKTALKPNMEKMERIRLNKLRLIKRKRKDIFVIHVFLIALVSVFVLFVILLYKHAGSSDLNTMYVFLILAPGIIYFLYQLRGKRKKGIERLQKAYLNQFKPSIFTPLTKSILPIQNYDAVPRIHHLAFPQSKLFKFHPINIESEDYMDGKINDCFFSFSEIKSFYQPTKEDSIKSLFQGLFFEIKLPHSFDFLYLVANDKVGLVEMNNKHYIPPKYLDYGNQFSFFWHHPYRAEPMLTAQLLDFFSTLKKEHGAQILFKIENNKMHLGIDWSLDLFETDIEDSLLNSTIKKIKEEEVLDANIQFSETATAAFNKYYGEVKIIKEVLDMLSVHIDHLMQLKEVNE